jgi:hypothetical protein
MNRVDTKFIFTFAELIEFLPELQKYYDILDIDGLRLPRYESDYFDSDAMDFYIDHHRQKINRFKVRFRKYVESNLSFLEVKHKVKGRTDKRRIMVEDLSKHISKEQQDFIQKTGIEQNNLHYVLTNSFQRITLVGKQRVERLTFDINLEFSGNNTVKQLNQLVIAELKQERLSRQSPFYKIMKRRLIRPYRLSKYCIGVIELYGKSNVKYNRFKKKLLRINKLQVNAA